MSAYHFDFHGMSLQARPSGALWWPDAGWLILGDLHLGKSGRMARRGGALLPPYETAETLSRLRHEADALSPSCIIILGDGFDDLGAVAELDDPNLALIHALAQGRDWLWVTGNHDPLADCDGLPGRVTDGVTLGNIRFCHQANPGQTPDISAHYHPAVPLGGQRRRAFLIGDRHLILPAFGAYTGGLAIDHPALSALVPKGIAAACCGAQVLPVPVPMPAIRRRRGIRPGKTS